MNYDVCLEESRNWRTTVQPGSMNRGLQQVHFHLKNKRQIYGIFNRLQQTLKTWSAKQYLLWSKVFQLDQRWNSVEEFLELILLAAMRRKHSFYKLQFTDMHLYESAFVVVRCSLWIFYNN